MLFDDKVIALSLLRNIGLTKTVSILSRVKKVSPPNMRDMLDNLQKTHFLVDEGLVEITSAGVLQFVKLNFPQQPQPLTKEYFEKLPVNTQEELQEAFAVLRCNSMLRSFKPYPVIRKSVTYAKNKI